MDNFLKFSAINRGMLVDRISHGHYGMYFQNIRYTQNIFYDSFYAMTNADPVRS